MVPQIKQRTAWLSAVVGVIGANLIAGCGLVSRSAPAKCCPSTDTCYSKVVSNLSYPDARGEVVGLPISTAEPITIENLDTVEFWDLTLADAISMTLGNSTVIRDLGGQVLRSPATVNSIHTPAIQETDPRFGVEAALSAFDATMATRLVAEKNDRPFNNILFGGGTRLFGQDLINYSNEISKLSAVGTRMTARHNIQYDYNNAPGNNIPNLPWAANFEVEVRHPLMRGSGANFNRIAGPNATPGFYNGVLIARIDADISITEFEARVRDLVSDVETAYWELYFAYRNLDASKQARDQALETWRRIETLSKTGRRGGGAEKEARAREQYFRAQADVENALTGHLPEPSRSTTFRGAGGIHTQERALRMLIGAPINDGRLIRPQTEPTVARVVFPWDECLVEATTSRAELRKQQQQIKRRELEVIAAKNFLLPQLDLIGRYRWRGLGHDLIDPSGDNEEFGNAYQNLFDGNFQEWQAGVEMLRSVGGRQGHAAVRNACLRLQREKAIMDEQQRQVTLELSNAIAEKERAYVLSQTQLNRKIAAAQQLAATEALYDEALENQKDALLDELLDAQRRLADGDIQYSRSLAEYMLAIKQVHFAKGSLLAYNQILLTEGNWPAKAVQDAGELHGRQVSSPTLQSHVGRAIGVN